MAILGVMVCVFAAGCEAVNTFGGPYTATDDGAFSAGELQATAIGGSQDAMRAESLYFDLLRRAVE